MKTTFAKNMTARRLELGWTQEQAAVAIGTSKANIGAWEESRAYPYADTLSKIARAYKVIDLNLFLFGKSKSMFTTKETDIISKYYSLSKKEKKVVDVLLGLES